MDSVTMIRVVAAVIAVVFVGCDRDPAQTDGYFQTSNRQKVAWVTEVLTVLNSTRNTVLGDQIRVADTSLSRLVGLLGKRNA